jgi:hypothetical protein
LSFQVISRLRFETFFSDLELEIQNIGAATIKGAFFSPNGRAIISAAESESKTSFLYRLVSFF